MSPDCLLGVVPQPTDSRLSETTGNCEISPESPTLKILSEYITEVMLLTVAANVVTYIGSQHSCLFSFNIFTGNAFTSSAKLSEIRKRNFAIPELVRARQIFRETNSLITDTVAWQRDVDADTVDVRLPTGQYRSTTDSI